MEQRGTATVGRRMGSVTGATADELVDKALAQINGQVAPRNDVGPLDLSGLVPTTSIGKATGSLVDIAKSRQAEGAAAATVGVGATAAGLSTVAANAKRPIRDEARARLGQKRSTRAVVEHKAALSNAVQKKPRQIWGERPSRWAKPEEAQLYRSSKMKARYTAGTKANTLRAAAESANRTRKVRLVSGGAAAAVGAGLTLAGIKRAESGRG